jgi:formylmethanofuran dehydrogenase subunit E
MINLNLKKMEDSTNDNNLANLRKLIPHFYLDEDSYDQVIKSTYCPPIPKSCEIPLNDHHRLFLPITNSEEHDEAWILLKTELNWKTALSPEEPITYEHWLKGYAPNGQKLFRYLKKFFSEEILQELSTARNTDTRYLVISKNPMDWIFMATNQSFSSCMGLESTYRNAYYMGLPVYLVNPCFFFLFITNGKLRTHTIKGLEFKHFRYINRNICTWTGDRFGIGRYYPYQSIRYENILRQYTIGAETDDWSSDPEEQIIPELFFENGKSCMPYYDIQCRGNMASSSGSSGSLMSLNWSRGFEEMEELHQKPQWKCESCGCHIDEDNFLSHNGDGYCEDCFNELFSYCERCDEYYPQDETTFIQDLDSHWCNHCASHHSVECESCNERFSEDYYDTSTGDSICHSCFERHSYYSCKECGDAVHPDDATVTEDSLVYCDNCKDDNTHQCELCDRRWHDKDYLCDIDGALICEDCRDDNYYQCAECGNWIPNKDLKNNLCIFCRIKSLEEEAA